MATTSALQQQTFDLSSPEAATVWSSMLNMQITNNQHYLLSSSSGLSGEGQDYCFCWDKDLQKNDGGTLHKTLMLSLDHEGVPGTSTLRGKEGGIDTTGFEYQVSDWRGGWAFKRPLSEELVAFNLLDNYTSLVSEWCLRRDWFIMLGHLAGYTANVGSGWVDHTNRQIDFSKTDVWTRGNAIKAPAPQYHFRGTAANVRTTDETVVAGDELDLPTIYRVERLIRRRRFPLRPPIKYSGKPYWPWFIGPKTAELLAQDSDINNIWTAMLQGGQIQDNPLFNNASGIIRNFVFFVLDDMPPGVDSVSNEAVTTVERWVIPGANSISWQFTGGFTPSNRWKYKTGTDDGGWETFLHVFGIGGWSATQYRDPKALDLTSDNDLVDFKFVGTSFTG